MGLHGGEAHGPQIRGSIRFDAFMILGADSVAFMTTDLTLRPDNTAVDETPGAEDRKPPISDELQLRRLGLRKEA
jgi:hypothetical protein